MSTTITLEDIHRAWGSRDPNLPNLIVELAREREPYQPPRKDGAFTFADYYREIRSWNFKYKTKEEQKHYSVERMKELEGQDPEVPLPDRLKLWTVLVDLWEKNGPYERSCLLEIIEKVPLRWGAWRALKRIFKQAEKSHDTEVFGAIAARLDQSFQHHRDDEVTRRTLSYLRRRAWRYLRRQAETLPATYADAAVDILRFYTIESDNQWRQNWISSHIWFHESGNYSRNGFHLPWRLPSLIKQRAYGDLWRRTPRPLFTLLERAKSELARKYAVEALKNDFRASLREVEPAWVIRLINVRSQSIDDFVVWLLKNVPRFEQGAFRDLGLHDPVLSLLSSPSNDARAYAAAYARTHARDLPLEQLIRLIDNDHEEVRKLAVDLIQDRDPRKEVGLEAWGQLLETKHGHKLAAEVLKKHFGVRELQPAWFKERLLSENGKVFKFATKLLPKIHPFDSLGSVYFQDLIEDDRVVEQEAMKVIKFAFGALEKFSADKLDLDFIKRSLLQPMTSEYIQDWIGKGKFSVKSLNIDFIKALAHEPDWEKNEWLAALIKSGRSWTEDLEFDWSMSRFAFGLLEDRRYFDPSEVGLKWLMNLVQSSDTEYYNFAVKYMTEAFSPSNFAPEGATGEFPGCQYLWDSTIAEGEETPFSRFSQNYIRHHHPDISKELGDEPNADQGFYIPEGFFTFERVKPILSDNRNNIRSFALELSKWSLRAWDPSMEDLVELCESPYSNVFEFVSKALLADDKEEHARYRIDLANLTPEAAYRFCESLDKATRSLGMELIAREPRLADPIELFRLSESPDRQVRAFVIRTIWSLYRDRGITMHWTAAPRKTKKAKTEEDQGPGGPPSKPESMPASQMKLRDFLRMILFTIPPARLPKSAKSKKPSGGRLRPLAARRAKLSFIEVIRDLAIEQRDFAAFVWPLLQEFMASRGKSEHDSCLVALTRIRKAHGNLDTVEVS